MRIRTSALERTKCSAGCDSDGRMKVARISPANEHAPTRFASRDSKDHTVAARYPTEDGIHVRRAAMVWCSPIPCTLSSLALFARHRRSGNGAFPWPVEPTAAHQALFAFVDSLAKVLLISPIFSIEAVSDSLKYPSFCWRHTTRRRSRPRRLLSAEVKDLPPHLFHTGGESAYTLNHGVFTSAQFMINRRSEKGSGVGVAFQLRRRFESFIYVSS